jgi:alpha-L-fucosidase
MLNGEWARIGAGTTIGPRRILRTQRVHTDRIRLRINASRACPVLRRLGLFCAGADG